MTKGRDIVMVNSNLVYESDFCYSLEKDYSNDHDIKQIYKDGVTPQLILTASRLIRERENSPLIKLNFETIPIVSDETDPQNIENLPEIIDIACSSGSLKMVMECIEFTKSEDIMLKMQGPFSILLSLVGGDQLFKWLCKYKNEINYSLDKITDAISDYATEAINKGVRIISLADPSAMADLLGEKKYKEFSAKYLISFLNKIEPYLENSLVHLCPRTSIILEKYGFVTSEIIYYERGNYAQALIELAQHSTVKFVGHRCVNAETVKNDKIYVLKLR